MQSNASINLGGRGPVSYDAGTQENADSRRKDEAGSGRACWGDTRLRTKPRLRFDRRTDRGLPSQGTVLPENLITRNDDRGEPQGEAASRRNPRSLISSSDLECNSVALNPPAHNLASFHVSIPKRQRGRTRIGNVRLTADRP